MPPEGTLTARTGIGYDSHRFTAGRPMILGGVKIESELGLLGHSDADAVAHALTDAILGAACAGDIGSMFPDSDPVNKGRDSMEMLSIAVERIESMGFRVAHSDITVIAESPRIGPHRSEMCDAIARACRVQPGVISVKGKSNEGMGWIGRGEGLACIAVATLVMR